MKHLKLGQAMLAGKNNPRLAIEVKHYIRPWRLHRKLSIHSLAQAARLSGSAISQLERGRARYTQESLEKIAAALQVTPGQLLTVHPAESFEEKLAGEATTALYNVNHELAHRIIGQAVTDYLALRKEAPAKVLHD